MTEAERFIDTFRRGFLPQLKPQHVAALREALRTDDPALAHGFTVRPIHRHDALHAPAERACLVGYCCIARGARSAAEVSFRFGQSCQQARELLGPGGYGEVSGMLAFWDGAPCGPFWRRCRESNQSLAALGVAAGVRRQGHRNAVLAHPP